MSTTEGGDGHDSKIVPISRETLNRLAQQLQDLFAQALREAVENRLDALSEKGQLVVELVADIADPAFRRSVHDILLTTKIASILAVLQYPPFELISEAEFQEMHAHLLSLQQRERRPPSEQQ